MKINVVHLPKQIKEITNEVILTLQYKILGVITSYLSCYLSTLYGKIVDSLKSVRGKIFSWTKGCISMNKAHFNTKIDYSGMDAVKVCFLGFRMIGIEVGTLISK